MGYPTGRKANQNRHICRCIVLRGFLTHYAGC